MFPESRSLHVALTIAGSDPSGGAGIQADLKTFQRFGVYGTAVLTLLTVQNTCGVRQVDVLEPSFILSQLDAVLQDIPPQACKTGALGNEGVIRAIAEAATEWSFPLVVDPVMLSKHGAPLLAPDACDALLVRLLPQAFLVTPNLHEAGALARMPVRDVPSMEEAARRIAESGVGAVLVKGGHLQGEAVDVLWSRDGIRHFRAPRMDTPHTHGTGCTYSAAITAGLAAGASLPDAVAAAKEYITRAIRFSPGLGKGSGPVNHLV
jgi:hydroxymethylpyrimidine/phosphomethylpyrimidine kinase